ncbi:MAG: hypothetical protein ACP5VS_02815 [Desulfomonilaceae bacterium]
MRNLVMMILIFLLPTWALAAGGTIRDGSGNLVETWTRHGDNIEIRDKSNNLTRQLHKHGDRIEIRDGKGNLIGEEQRNSD